MLLLAGYLLFFPPLFVLGPLAGLLAASRPATPREWAWIAVAVLWLGVSLWQPGGLAEQVPHAWALFLTAAFVTVMLTGRRPVVAGAVFASLAGLAMTTGWAWLLGSRWHDIRLAVAHNGWDLCRIVLAGGAAASPERVEGLRAVVNAMAEAVGLVSDVFPGVLVLAALPGLTLAWAWYHRLAACPIGPPPGRFRDFRFSDHGVWAVVLVLAVALLPAPPAVRNVTANVAVVAGGLYLARGAAVAWPLVADLPLAILLLLGVGLLFVLPVALGGLFALGLADTWVDFRRRQKPPHSTRN